jgi:type I restriction enzyme, S subunit
MSRAIGLLDVESVGILVEIGRTIMVEKWSRAALEKLCIIGDGNHSSKYPKKSEMVSDGVPFIRSTNLVDGQISREDILYISKEKHQELKKGHLRVNDVLFTNRGEIGKVAIVDDVFDGANLAAKVSLLFLAIR